MRGCGAQIPRCSCPSSHRARGGPPRHPGCSSDSGTCPADPMRRGEMHAQERQVVERRGALRFAGGDDQHAGHVVGAVAVLAASARGRAHARRWHARRSCGGGGENRAREHAVRLIPVRAVLRGDDRPGCRYSPATTDHPRLGAMRHASAAMAAASSGLVRTRRSAWASASGSSWPTTMPAPVESSSAACGNAVATTGLPAAMASTSTPDVTWSLES